MATVLITGGTGFIGKHLSELLQKKGYTVTFLSRNKNTLIPNTYYWNISASHIDSEAIKTADYIIHLAGTNISSKKWSKKQKELIYKSRIETTNLLFEKIKQYRPNLKAFIAASAVGFYGTVTSEKIYTEEDTCGNDFLSKVCAAWEKASLQFNTLTIRTVILRTGVVFAKNEGAFKKITQPIKSGIGAVLGNGNQYIPWIHINDLCEMYITAIENTQLNGIYNAVAPKSITNKELTYKIAASLNKKIWLPKIPTFVLQLIFGEMASILLKGSRVSSKKIESAGFQFKFKNITAVLNTFFQKES